MSRFLFAIILVLLAVLPAPAQYVPPVGGVDAYYGLTDVPCSNANTSFKIDSTTYPLFPVLCTPLGHGQIFRCPNVMDINLNNSYKDEFGKSYQDYVTAKGMTNAQWYTNILKQITQYYGYNCAGMESNLNLFPITGQTYKVPHIIFDIVSPYSLINEANWSVCCAKPTFKLLSPQWHGFTSSNELADYRDPKWESMLKATFLKSTVFQDAASASAANRGYILFGIIDDSDNLHCFGAGPDFATQPAGNNDFRCGYIPFFITPMAFASSLNCYNGAGQSCNYGGTLYVDPNVYWKSRWIALSLAAHGGTVAGVNAAWGSGYTTPGSSGTCVDAPVIPFPCATSISTPDTIGTGDGVSCTFGPLNLTHTLIDKFSVGIFKNGIVSGGDTGSGALIGPTLAAGSGSINYSTGSIKVVFTAGQCPAAGVAITAAYVSQGWGQGGTGMADEDCRAGNSAYCGNGSGGTTINLTGIPAAVQTDINAFTQDLAGFYSSTIDTDLQSWWTTTAHGVGRLLNAGCGPCGTWTTPGDRYVLQGFAGHFDVYTYGGQGVFSQAELDFVHTYMGNIPLFPNEYKTANAQSEFAWPNSPCTHATTTVTCTGTSPTGQKQIFSSNTICNTGGPCQSIDSVCTNPDYNITNVRPTAVSPDYNTVLPGTTFTLSYTKSPAPVEATSTCDFFFSDANVGGYASQSAKGNSYFALNLSGQTYTATGFHPFIIVGNWDVFDDQTVGSKLSWAQQTVKGNSTDGLENVTGSVPCQPPMAAFTCGGERNPGGNSLSGYQTAHMALDCAVLTLTGNCNGPVVQPHAPCPMCFLSNAKNSAPVEPITRTQGELLYENTRLISH